jgi:hypothetical protein
MRGDGRRQRGPVTGKWYTTMTLLTSGGLVLRAERRHFTPTGDIARIERSPMHWEISPPAKMGGEWMYEFDGEPYAHPSDIRRELEKRLNAEIVPDWQS